MGELNAKRGGSRGASMYSVDKAVQCSLKKYIKSIGELPIHQDSRPDDS